MSQQGPGGYGGSGGYPPGGGAPPPGGYGPPGGAPPGGYGPPGGAPPGGYGPPGGAPPGGYGPPGGAPPGGWGPPGGPPPGGYGPPGGPPGPGGYGPGGYGPPGAPPAPGGYGPPGAPPGGYGPPGAPPGYGGYPPGGPPVAPAKKSKALLWVGLGCGGFLLLSIAGGIASYFYVKGQVSDAESAIAAAASAGVVGAPASGPISATCAKAVACCQSSMAKSVGAGSAIASAACTALGRQSDPTCAQLYDSYKRAAAVSGATCP